MLRILSEKKQRAFYEKYRGCELPVLFEGLSDDGYLHGFTDNYIKVRVKMDSSISNQIIPCILETLDDEQRIFSAMVHSLN